MTNDKGILIKNIYYMLSYAFQVLKQQEYENVASEEFDEVYKLFAAILCKGVPRLLKQGLHKEYIIHHDNLTSMRGKLDINGTIVNKMQQKQLLACEYDELSENNIYNQIIKTTIYCLIRADGVKPEHKTALKKLIAGFGNVDLISKDTIKWNTLHYYRNNRNYEMLLNICYLVLNGLIQTTEKGEYKLMAFSDEQMQKLYEKFILEYYKRHFSDLNPRVVSMDWDCAGGSDEEMIKFLPKMKTDITLSKGNKTLIIDAKYYGKVLSSNFDKHTFHSGNMYQIFSYVKNMDKDNTGNVSGLLLYAKTQEEDLPKEPAFAQFGKNKIGVGTLDLNTGFTVIKLQLDKLADIFFG